MNTKKIIICILLALTLATQPQTAHAAVLWGTLNIVGDFWKQMAEEISLEIRNAINAAGKMAAIKQATSTIESLLYGSSSSQRNISNYHEFLTENPQEEAVTYAQDFLTQTLRGTTSGDYISASESGSDSLSEELAQAGDTVIAKWEGTDPLTTDYQNYCSDTSNFFADGNYQCFNAIMSNPVNTPIGVALATDQVLTAKFEEAKAEAALEATSSGVLPDKDENGDIKLPTSVVAEIQLQQITLPLEALANGDTDVFSNMIQSFAIGLVVGVVERGLGETQESIDKNIAAFESQYAEAYSSLQSEIGPALEYSGGSYNTAQQQKQEQTQPWVNPDDNTASAGEWVNPDDNTASAGEWVNPDDNTASAGEWVNPDN